MSATAAHAHAHAHAAAGDDLRAIAVELHQDFQSLGLLARHGDMCLVMALALTKVLGHLGIPARVQHCNLVIAHAHGAFLLGFQERGDKVPDELVDTHAVCVADDRLLIDFGLGQARKAWHVPVYESAVAAYTPGSPVLATHFVDGCAYVWMAQVRCSARVRAVMDGNTALARGIFEQWLAARAVRRSSRSTMAGDATAPWAVHPAELSAGLALPSYDTGRLANG